jgi:small subunit ribosomal protein S5
LERRKYSIQESRFNIAEWVPHTEIGRKVKAGEITSIEQIFSLGKKIEETEIIDALIPDLKGDVIEVSSVQRMTKNNRKAKFRVVAVVGDGRGHVGVGSGKDVEVKAAVDSAMRDAKKNIMPMLFGCGSWQCGCGTQHSIPFIVSGKCGGVSVILKPAPRGTGIVASKPVTKMLEFAGIKDVWSFSRGRTKSRYNALMAVEDAINQMLSMKNLQSAKVGTKAVPIVATVDAAKSI